METHTMKMHIHRALGSTIVLSALAGSTIVGINTAQAMAPNVSCGTVRAEDGVTAGQLNSVLTGTLRSAMTSYRVSCARAIVNTVRARGLSERAAVIAITTVIVESNIENNPNVLDHTSVGLFQQQESWGSTANRLDPAWATNAFLNHMITAFPNGSWQNEQIGTVCQAVQKSAYGSRYQPQASDAQKIVSAIGRRTADVTGDGLADILTQEPDGGVTVGVNMGNGFTNY
ncbi:hypothetical protein ACWD28_41940, partial [Streptomyces sp. NPDC002746]